MVLSPCAQRWPVLWGGLPVPPARIEPVTFRTSTLSKQDGCSGSVFPPELWQGPPAGVGLSPQRPPPIRSIRPTLPRKRPPPRGCSDRGGLRGAAGGETGGAAPGGRRA